MIVIHSKPFFGFETKYENVDVDFYNPPRTIFLFIKDFLKVTLPFFKTYL